MDNKYRTIRVFRVVEIFVYLLVIVISLGAAFLLRFDFLIAQADLLMLQQAALIAMLIKGPVFYFAGINGGLRRFVGLPDLWRLVLANLTASVLFTCVMAVGWGGRFPRSVFLLDLILCFLLSTLICFSERIYSEIVASENNNQRRKEILIYGAGTAGVSLLRDIRSHPNSGYQVVGFLDDDLSKRGASALGVRVLGTGREAAAIQDSLQKRNRSIDEIVLAIPSASGRQMQEAVSNCRAAKVACKTLPSLSEILEGRVLTDQIRSVNLADVLGRQPVEVDRSPIYRSIGGRSILVTGAAGSIGSELCRQIAEFRPDKLVAFDQAESDLFRLECELREHFPNLDLKIALGDLQDRERVSEVIKRYSIESIFHAAAYKHVPMMESHVLEAAKNNILGTWNLLNIARQNRVSDFLLISSDKAVNPTGVMGATKRVCELMTSCNHDRNGSGGMKCVAVRFGNVLGSNGSVVPIFQAQIAAGGPVKVTHPEIKRYFMTISEAVLLVLQASTMGKGSEIFVLDMGEPILIADLAKNLIRLAGHEPYKDIDIQFTGLRPGEKLYEEMSLPTEDTLPTRHEKIKIFRQDPPDHVAVQEWVRALQQLIAWRKDREVLSHLQQLVPEYRPEFSGREGGNNAVPELFPSDLEHLAKAS